MARANKQAAVRTDDTVITIIINGDSYKLRPGDLTGRLIAKVRGATGQSLRSALEALSEDPDIDALSALCYAAALQEGRDVRYDEIADGITYGSEIDVVIGNGSEDDEGEA